MHRSTAMRFHKVRHLIVCTSIVLVLPSCKMFRQDSNQVTNPSDPYSQYGAGGAYGAQPSGVYGAPQANTYGATPGYTVPPTGGGYTPPPYTQPADAYGSGGGSSGGAASGGRAHTVVRGDTLSRIGRRYSVGVSELMRANNLESDLIREGQQLTIP